MSTESVQTTLEIGRQQLIANGFQAADVTQELGTAGCLAADITTDASSSSDSSHSENYNTTKDLSFESVNGSSSLQPYEKIIKLDE
jgi:hypothetical protein